MYNFNEGYFREEQQMDYLQDLSQDPFSEDRLFSDPLQLPQEIPMADPRMDEESEGMQFHQIDLSCSSQVKACSVINLEDEQEDRKEQRKQKKQKTKGIKKNPKPARNSSDSDSAHRQDSSNQESENGQSNKRAAADSQHNGKMLVKTCVRALNDGHWFDSGFYIVGLKLQKQKSETVSVELRAHFEPREMEEERQRLFKKIEDLSLKNGSKANLSSLINFDENGTYLTEECKRLLREEILIHLKNDLWVKEDVQGKKFNPQKGTVEEKKAEKQKRKDSYMKFLLATRSDLEKGGLSKRAEINPKEEGLLN